MQAPQSHHSQQNPGNVPGSVSQQKPVEILELEHSIGYNGKYQDTVHFHPTHKDTFMYNIGGLLVLENLHDKHQQQFLRGHDMEISAIAVSKSGRLVATGQIGTVFQKLPDAPIILWNYETKEPIAVLKGMQVSVKKLAFSPDDRFLAALGENNTFIIWDTSDGSAIHTRVTEFPITVLTWGDSVDVTTNPKHPSYTLVTANQTNVFINKLQFEISQMQYVLK